MAWDGVRAKADAQVECYHSGGAIGTGDDPTGNNGSSTCVGSAAAPSPSPSPAPGTSPASQGINYSTTAMYMCKSDADFRSDGMEQAAQVMEISADDDTCSARNAAMLQRYGHASWHNITCDMVTAHKDAFYEHIVFGTLCCGSIQDADWASTRAKVRCLDSSTMCKAAADFKPTVYTTHHKVLTPSVTSTAAVDIGVLHSAVLSVSAGRAREGALQISFKFNKESPSLRARRSSLARAVRRVGMSRGEHGSLMHPPKPRYLGVSFARHLPRPAV